MIAKVVVWAPSRETAIDKMTHVLRNVACVGLRTNQGFLQSCLRHPAFRNPAYTTSFIPGNLNQLKRTVPSALHVLCRHQWGANCGRGDAFSALSPDSGTTDMMLQSPLVGAPMHVAVATLLSYFRHEAASIAPLALSGTSGGSEGIRAPMPCKVIAILKEDGEEVKKGEAVMVIESMKMETNIVASADGVFRKDVQPGQAVLAGKLLCTIT